MNNGAGNRRPANPAPDDGTPEYHGLQLAEVSGDILPQRSRTLVVAFAVLAVLLTGALDYTTGPGISLLLFYLAPIALATWFAGLIAGVAMSVLAALLLFLTRPLGAEGSIWEYSHYWNIFMRLGVFVVVAYIVSMQATLRRLLRREKELSRRDVLTGAANRRAFTEALSAEIERMSRYGRRFSLAYIDLDNFKSVNDRLGHASGDRLLRVVSGTLRKSMRSSDVVARLGGDEFAILLPETGAGPAESVIQKARGTVGDAIREGRWDVTMSIGILTFESPPESCDQALRKADALMYRAKSEGKNRVRHEVA